MHAYACLRVHNNAHGSDGFYTHTPRSVYALWHIPNQAKTGRSGCILIGVSTSVVVSIYERPPGESYSKELVPFTTPSCFSLFQSFNNKLGSTLERHDVPHFFLPIRLFAESMERISLPSHSLLSTSFRFTLMGVAVVHIYRVIRIGVLRIRVGPFSFYPI